jgi:hypothetical protein
VEEGTAAGAAAGVEVEAREDAEAAKAEGDAALAVFALATPPADGTKGAVETGAVAAALTPTGRDHIDPLGCGTRAAVELTALGADVVAVPAN